MSEFDLKTMLEEHNDKLMKEFRIEEAAKVFNAGGTIPEAELKELLNNVTFRELTRGNR